jgi:hypothetical protein
MSALPLEPLLLFGRFTSPTASEDERWAAVLARVIWRALTRRFLSLGMLGIAPNLLARLTAIFTRRKTLTWCWNPALPQLGSG